jgi:hypothetical protein
MRQAVAVDGVHLSPEGYSRLAKAIVTAVAGIREGKLTKSFANASSVTGGPPAPKLDFFWRGFNSLVGDAIGRAAANRNPRLQGRRGWRPHYPHYHHPYKKISKVKATEGTDETAKVVKPGSIQSLKKLTASSSVAVTHYNVIIYRLHSKLSFNELLLYVNHFNKRLSYMFCLFPPFSFLFLLPRILCCCCCTVRHLC